ncbi:MAG: hypothetical protein B6244_06925 [Candidatus Cloacimonetes bacterium 4572_55]|nr:MAG: hypothetical protein B6244_06925 [Candidatus Cloacimonetes bacterium 4572_55]
MKREVAYDALRGLFLVIMTIDHYGGPLRKYTLETFGFISGAEGFVFLSGLVAGFVYAKYAVRDPEQFYKHALRRSWTIYQAHIITFFILVATLFLSQTAQTLWPDQMKLIYERPIYGLLGLTMLFQPPDLDILPMYVVFVLLIPSLLKKFRQGKSHYILGISFLIWCLAQFGLKENFILFFAPYVQLELGYFDIIAWQFVFIFGAWLGYERVFTKRLSIPRNRYLISGTVIILVALMLTRHKIGPFEALWDYGVAEASAKGPLAWMRMINFVLAVYFIGWLIAAYNRYFNIPWLIFLGQHSLYVYSYHVVLIYYVNLIQPKIEESGEISELIVSLLLTASLTIPALLHKSYVDRQKKQLAKKIVTNES